MLKQLFTAAALVATTATAGMAQEPLRSITIPMDDGCQAQIIIESIDSDGDVNVVGIEDCGTRYDRIEAWVRCVTPSGLAWIAEKGDSNFREVEVNSGESFLAGVACDVYFWGS